MTWLIVMGGPTLEGDDSEGADSGRLRGGTGGGTGASSDPRLKLTMEDTEEDPETSRNTELLLERGGLWGG